MAVSPAAPSAGLPASAGTRVSGTGPASHGEGGALADNAPEAMLSPVTNTGVNSGLTAATSERLRTGNFPCVVPA